jgi:hypothetical protein
VHSARPTAIARRQALDEHASDHRGVNADSLWVRLLMSIVVYC